MPWRRMATILALLGPLLWCGGVRGEGLARIEGRLQLEVPDASLADLGPVVVFLDPVDGAPPFPTPRERVAIDQEGARFIPSFRAIVRGQTVDMPNRDAIFHNVFSFSPSNEFDLGMYPAGESRSVTFDHPGVVKVYCSIHERMSATIWVAPTPWFAVATPAGRFSIDAVPPGRYRLRTWTERLPETEARISLAEGQRMVRDIALVPSAP